MTAPSLTLLSPAKLNLFLHVTGRRPDGYHNLQTVFQLLNWGDTMRFSVRSDAKITVSCPALDMDMDANLAFRAARALKDAYGCDKGADIFIDKVLPHGAGLGGGSSNAATTLIALNRLWQLDLQTAELASLGKSLGADVPVFIHGHSAWAEGIGEILKPIDLPESWFVVIKPPVEIPTSEIFQSKELTRDTPAITIATFFEGQYRNDCEAVVLQRFPEVKAAYNWLAQHGKPHLTGTGSCVFLECLSEAQAARIAAAVPAENLAFAVQGINQSPTLTGTA